MNWTDIRGWFQWRSAQEEAALRFPDGSRFLEVGNFLGRSLCSLGDVVQRSGKRITVIGVEFGVLLGSIKKASEMLEAGTTNEVAISTDKMITIIRMLGPEYFLALALKPEGNFGKGRFLMRTAAPKLLAEL